MKRACLFGCLLSSAIFAQEPPKTMTMLRVQFQGPDVPFDSPSAKPMTMFRAGTQFCHVEGVPDSSHGIDGVAIINEPDIWMVNLETMTAQHFVDSGPTFNCHMPIFGNEASELPEGQGKEVGELEFGHELEFFNSKGARPETGPVLWRKHTIGYRLKYGDYTLALFTFGTPELPLAVAWIHGENEKMYWYSGYEQMVFDPKLFAKPENVKIEEAKQ